MTRTVFHPAARRALEETIDYYNAERPGLGREFREEVQRVIALLARFPRLGQPVRGSVRRTMLLRFPYHIYYRLLESGNLRILAVAHNRRMPEYWVGREPSQGSGADRLQRPPRASLPLPAAAHRQR